VTREDEDLEFATAEDLAKINADPSLKKLYDAMKAGVTKKFQGFAAEKKQLSEQLNSYTQVLKQWEEWRPILDSYITEGGHPDSGDDIDGNTRGDGRRRARGKVDDDGGRDALLDTFGNFKNEVAGMAQTFKQELTTLRRMQDLTLQLDDLRREHFEKYPKIKFDGQKILATALEKGYNDLGDAYNTVYRDDFIKTDVDTQVTSRLAEADAARRTQGETGSGATPMHMKLPDASPKSFSAASEGVLSEIRQGTLTKADGAGQ
jgi:hypothetical protein